MCENAQPAKRKRVLLTLDKKLEVLDSIAEGETHANVAKKFNLSESTVRTIKNTEQSIRNSARYGSAMGNSIMYSSRPLSIEMMETNLNAWYTQRTLNGSKLTNRELCDKAVEIFNEIKSPIDFTVFRASNSWLLNFKRRFAFQNSKSGFSINEIRDGREFKQAFKNVIEQRSFLPEQVFHLDIDELFWKRLPTTELRYFNEKISMLFCCNATGDFISKPMIAYNNNNKSIGSCTLKNASLPVFWSQNPNNCIMEKDLEEWYIECFITNVSRYLVTKSLSPKILLLMENTMLNSTLLKIPIGEVSVTIQMFPKGCDVEFQPLRIGIFPAFKRYYMRRTLSYLSQKIFFNPGLKVIESWRVFDIMNAIEIIKDSIDEISASDINACWRSLWPEIVHEYSTLPNEEAEINEILQVVREINDPTCFQIQSKDITIALSSSYSNEKNMSDKEQTVECDSDIFIIELDDSRDDEFSVENEAESAIANGEEQPMPALGMPLESINNIFASALALERLVLKLDPSINRSMKFSEELGELLRPYKEEKLKILGSL